MIEDERERNRPGGSPEIDPEGLNFRHLHYFHAVATAGSIVRAAKSLDVAQPTISEQIKMLETYLETPLFDRKPGGLRLNEHGRRVYEHTKVMFRAARRLVHEVRPGKRGQNWVLEVGLCPSVSRTLASRRLVRIFELPEVMPRIRVGIFDDMLEDLLTGELDLLISANRPPDIHLRRVAVQRLAESAIVFVASPEMATRVTSFPDGLTAVPLMQYTHGSRYRWELDAMLLDAAISPEVVGEVDDVEFMAMAAQRGICVAAVPESVVKPAIEEGKLVLLGPSASGNGGGVYALYAQLSTPQLVRDAIAKLSSDD